MNPKILVFAGSAREDSLNKKLARVGARAVDAAGGQATFIDLRDYPLPLYDGDLEAREGIPANAKRLKQVFIDHQGLLIASPENNASMSALLKNTIDWISRQDGEQSGLVPYAHKVAALMAASPSVRGGLRGVPHLRASLEALNVLVLPGYVTIPHADAAFADDGVLKDPEQQKAVAAAAKRLVATIAKLAQ